MEVLDEGGGFTMLYKRRVAMAALEVMADYYNVPLSQMTMISRQRANVAFARQTAMYLCHVVGRLSFRDIALEFSRERSTVSHACHAVEDRRECADFDRRLGQLEEGLRERIRRFVLERDAPPHEAKMVANG